MDVVGYFRAERVVQCEGFGIDLDGTFVVVLCCEHRHKPFPVLDQRSLIVVLLDQSAIMLMRQRGGAAFLHVCKQGGTRFGAFPGVGHGLCLVDQGLIRVGAEVGHIDRQGDWFCFVPESIGILEHDITHQVEQAITMYCIANQLSSPPTIRSTGRVVRDSKYMLAAMPAVK